MDRCEDPSASGPSSACGLRAMRSRVAEMYPLCSSWESNMLEEADAAAAAAPSLVLRILVKSISENGLRKRKMAEDVLHGCYK